MEEEAEASRLRQAEKRVFAAALRRLEGKKLLLAFFQQRIFPISVFFYHSPKSRFLVMMLTQDFEGASQVEINLPNKNLAFF